MGSRRVRIGAMGVVVMFDFIAAGIAGMRAND
jgi:hypothetical protein